MPFTVPWHLNEKLQGQHSLVCVFNKTKTFHFFKREYALEPLKLPAFIDQTVCFILCLTAT